MDNCGIRKTAGYSPALQVEVVGGSMEERELQYGFSGKGKPRFRPGSAELPCLENHRGA